MTLFGNLQTEAMDVIDKEDVFEASTQDSETMASRSLNTDCLMLRCSMIASMIK